MATNFMDTKTPPPLFSPEFQRDPYPTYRRCLTGPPLLPMQGRPGIWLLFGYDECAKLSVLFMIGAAHRDPRQYSDPDSLDVRRAHNRHLAFGGDAHVCLGSTLARLEGRLSMSALMRRFPDLRLADEQPDWGPNFAFRGLTTLRVRV